MGRLTTSVLEAEGFVRNGTRLDAATAPDAPVGVDDGPGQDGVLDDVVVCIGRIAVDRLADDLELAVDKILQPVADELNLGLLEEAEAATVSDDVGRDERGVEGDDAAEDSIEGDGIRG